MLGRFTSEDSAQDGLNWYTYCNNSPIRHVDPTGHWVNVAIGGLIGGAIGWGTNLFTQLAGNSWNFGAIDQRSLWAATGAGVLTGAMAGATMGLSLGLGGAFASGALIGGAGYGAYNILNGTPATLGGYAGAMASSGLTAGVMHTAVNGLPNKIFANSSQTTDLYRAVGVREYKSITTNHAFVPGGNSLSAREFAFSYSEAQKYANWDTSKIAIVKTSIPTQELSRFEISRTIDVTIFKNGVFIVQPEMNQHFNNIMIGLKYYIGG